jgi:tRNA nucleotidyltransferase (CCA-adding enzyme)
MYLVGGYVRDKILGVRSKDMDYSVEAPSYDAMKEEIKRRGGTIFLEKPEYLTIRARVPEMGAADFVLCRKDGSYIDGRRPEDVEPGTLMDDLARRDFTMNAIALSEDGEYIDPFNGRQDIDDRFIRCVGDPADRFAEDHLRMLRAIRFSVTKDMWIAPTIALCLRDMADKLANVAIERVREEMLKAMHHDTLATLKLLEDFPNVRDVVFGDSELWLKPTLEK